VGEVRADDARSSGDTERGMRIGDAERRMMIGDAEW